MAGKKGVIPSHVTKMQFTHAGAQLPIIQVLEGISDPRRPSQFFQYSLTSVLFMTLVAVVCGANDWPKVVVFCKSLENWLAEYVDMSNGVPCERTFKNIFNSIDPKGLEKTLRDLASLIRKRIPLERISFDGQTEKGTADRRKEIGGLHLLSAWSLENGICLGQVKVDDKSNEIKAMPELMDLLDLKGTIVTADALNTQKSVVEKVISKGADYLLPVKGNQPGLLEEIKSAFDESDRAEAVAKTLWEYNVAKSKENRDKLQLDKLLAEGPPVQTVVHTECEKAHGRIEVKSCEVLTANELPSLEKWEDLRSIARIRRERTKAGCETQIEIVYYITSLDPDAKLIAESIRSHWGIENSLHWRLDVAFRQDKSRYRDRVGAQNLAVMRKLALNALRREGSIKAGTATKMFAAACDPTYRAKLLKKLF